MTGLAQGPQAAGVLVEHRKAHGIQVLQDADGTFARHTQRLAQHARGGSTAGFGDDGGDELARVSLSGSGQGNVALDLNDRAVERKLAQGTRHGVAAELQLFAHLGKRRCIEAGFVQQGNDTFAGLAHHTRRGGSGVRVEYLGTLGGAHATRAALGNQSRGNDFIGGRPRSMGDGAGRKARLLRRRCVHG